MENFRRRIIEAQFGSDMNDLDEFHDS
jgi:hypothetical protein